MGEEGALLQARHQAPFLPDLAAPHLPGPPHRLPLQPRPTHRSSGESTWKVLSMTVVHCRQRMMKVLGRGRSTFISWHSTGGRGRGEQEAPAQGCKGLALHCSPKQEPQSPPPLSLAEDPFSGWTLKLKMPTKSSHQGGNETPTTRPVLCWPRDHCSKGSTARTLSIWGGGHRHTPAPHRLLGTPLHNCPFRAWKRPAPDSTMGRGAPPPLSHPEIRRASHSPSTPPRAPHLRQRSRSRGAGCGPRSPASPCSQ